MVMCSLQLTGSLPFTEVYLHAMVRSARHEALDVQDVGRMQVMMVAAFWVAL